MTKQKIVVRKYKGDRALQRGLRAMDASGYDVDQQASRKALATLSMGLLTRKQIHTVTFRLRDDVDEPVQASESKHWWQEPTVRDVVEGRGQRRANRAPSP